MELLVLILIGWIIMVFLVPALAGAESRKIGFIGGMVACLFLSPLIGLLIIIASPVRDIRQEDAQRAYKKGADLLLKSNLTEKRLEKSIGYLRHASSLMPKNHLYQINLSAALSAAGISDQSFHHFKKAVENGFSDFKRIENNSLFDNLRAIQRYNAYVKNGYIDAPNPTISKADELTKAKALLDTGAIDQAEYYKMKSEIINQ